MGIHGSTLAQPIWTNQVAWTLSVWNWSWNSRKFPLELGVSDIIERNKHFNPSESITLHGHLQSMVSGMGNHEHVPLDLGVSEAKGMGLPIGRQEWDRKSTCGPTHNVKKTWNSREKTWTTVSDRERPFICVKGIGPKMAWITVNNCLFWKWLAATLKTY